MISELFIVDPETA